MDFQNDQLAIQYCYSKFCVSIILHHSLTGGRGSREGDILDFVTITLNNQPFHPPRHMDFALKVKSAPCHMTLMLFWTTKSHSCKPSARNASGRERDPLQVSLQPTVCIQLPYIAWTDRLPVCMWHLYSGSCSGKTELTHLEVVHFRISDIMLVRNSYTTFHAWLRRLVFCSPYPRCVNKLY